MFAAFQERTRDSEVRAGWRGNGCRINQFCELSERFCRRGAEFFCDAVCAGKIDIVNGGKIDAVDLRIQPGVVASDVSNTHNADPEFFYWQIHFESVRSIS